MNIKPNDIENIEIVKGATVAMLYGTDAANGVIQLFTKEQIIIDGMKETPHTVFHAWGFSGPLTFPPQRGSTRGDS
jgi:TonB-dependent SusC/RagA subfamily outer membrane receptor